MTSSVAYSILMEILYTIKGFMVLRCLGCLSRASDFWPSVHGFDTRSGHYQAPRSTQPSIPPW